MTGLLVLTVAEDGTARGRIVAESSFMWLREQRATRDAVKPPMKGVWEPHEPVGVLWLVDPWGSWAKLTHTSPTADQDEFPVLQAGPRRLWDEVEAACRWWLDAGSPGADRWLLTVTPAGQRVQLNDGSSTGNRV